MSTSVTAIGNLTRNPQLSRTGDGTPVVKPSLADNARRLVDRELVDTSYPECAVRAQPARHASLHRGARAIAVGAVRTHTWSSVAGEEQSALEIVADEIGPSLRWTITERTRTGSTKQQTGSGPRRLRAEPNSRQARRQPATPSLS